MLPTSDTVLDLDVRRNEAGRGGNTGRFSNVRVLVLTVTHRLPDREGLSQVPA